MWAFSELLAFVRFFWAFSIGQEGHPSQRSNILFAFRRQDTGRKHYLAQSSLNLADIPYNGDSRKILVLVSVKYVLSKNGLFLKTVPVTFVQERGLNHSNSMKNGLDRYQAKSKDFSVVFDYYGGGGGGGYV